MKFQMYFKLHNLETNFDFQNMQFKIHLNFKNVLWITESRNHNFFI